MNAIDQFLRDFQRTPTYLANARSVSPVEPEYPTSECHICHAHSSDWVRCEHCKAQCCSGCAVEHGEVRTCRQCVRAVITELRGEIRTFEAHVDALLEFEAKFDGAGGDADPQTKRLGKTTVRCASAQRLKSGVTVHRPLPGGITESANGDGCQEPSRQASAGTGRHQKFAIRSADAPILAGALRCAASGDIARGMMREAQL